MSRRAAIFACLSCLVLSIAGCVLPKTTLYVKNATTGGSPIIITAVNATAGPISISIGAKILPNGKLGPLFFPSLSSSGSYPVSGTVTIDNPLYPGSGPATYSVPFTATGNLTIGKKNTLSFAGTFDATSPTYGISVTNTAQ